MSISSNFKLAASAFFGFLIAAIGGYFLRMEMQATSPRPGVVYMFAGFIGVGLLAVAPSFLFGILQRAVALFQQVKTGGNRITDPPAQPPNSAGKP